MGNTGTAPHPIREKEDEAVFLVCQLTHLFVAAYRAMGALEQVAMIALMAVSNASSSYSSRK